MPEPVKVFLSYVESDRDIVSKLYSDLKKAGFVPWMVDKDLLPGDVLSDGIDTAIHKSDAFLICMSTDESYLRRSIIHEIRSSLEALSKRNSVIIPVMLGHREGRRYVSGDIAYVLDALYKF